MAFDKKHYREIKKFVLWNLNNPQILSNATCPIEWAKTFIPQVSDCIHRQDYEGAKATSDAIREFLNKFSDEPIPEHLTLKLPEYKEIKVTGLLTYGKGAFGLDSYSEPI